MRYLQARVVGGQRHVRTAEESHAELELDLACANAGDRRRIVERGDHAVAVAHRQHLDRRRLGRALVDDDLPLRARVRGERRDSPPVDGDALRALGEEQVHDILDVLVVHQVARLPSRRRTPHAVGQVDLNAWAVHGGQPRVSAQIGDLVLQGLGRRRAAGRLGFQLIDLGSQDGDLAPGAGVGRLQLLDAPHEGLVAGDLVGGGQQLRLDLPRDEETHGKGYRAHRDQAEQLPARHTQQLCGESCGGRSTIGS